MRLRITLWSATVLLGAALLSSCSVRSARGRPANAAKPADAGPRSTAGRENYSASAVEARTEAHARYTAAILDELDDDPQSAAENYYKAALADSANEALVLEAAGKLLRQKRTDQAIELLKKSASRPDSGAGIHARLGLAYSVAGKKELAIESNRNAIRKDPTNFDGYQYLAQLHLQSDQKAEGLKVLDEAARQPKTDAGFLIDLGEAYIAFARGSSQEAIRSKALDAFARAAAMEPSSPVLLQRLGDGFNQLGKSDLAVQYYTQLLKRVPKLTFVRDRLVELYLRRQEKEKAAEQLRIVLQESPANPQAQYLLGSIYFEDRKLAEAEECFSRTLMLNPDFEPVYYDLAAVLINSDQPRRALETLEKARTRFPQNFVGEFYTAQAHSRLKDYAAALKHFTAAEIVARATATNRLTHTFYFQLGSAFERNQKFQEAERYFRKSLELAPDFPEALNYLGYMWTDRGENLDEARAMIEKAVKLDPKNAAFLDSLGWVLFKQGQPAEALKWIQKSIEHTEEADATLYDHLGDIYQKLDQPQKARDAWKKSVEIEPNPAVQKKLKDPSPATSTPSATSVPPSPPEKPKDAQEPR